MQIDAAFPWVSVVTFLGEAERPPSGTRVRAQVAGVGGIPQSRSKPF